jgi:hypothetical protein
MKRALGAPSAAVGCAIVRRRASRRFRRSIRAAEQSYRDNAAAINREDP